MMLKEVLREFKDLVNSDHPQSASDWVDGLSKEQADEILYRNLGKRLPYFVTQELYDLWEWSNGYRWWQFNGAFYEGLQDHTIGSYNYWREHPKLYNKNGFSSYCGLSMFGDGQSLIYLIPLTVEEVAHSPVQFLDSDVGKSEMCFESLYGFFKSSVETRKRGLPLPSPGVTNIETIAVARLYNPSVELWKRGKPLNREEGW